MLRDICARAEQSFFFAGPECNPNRASRFQAERLDNAHGFHSDGDSGAIVSCARARMPGIHVPAEHHDLVLQR